MYLVGYFKKQRTDIHKLLDRLPEGAEREGNQEGANKWL